jgi:hypothetical protein
MSKSRAYLVAVTVKSIHQIRVTATSEDSAIEEAERLWGEDESLFTDKGGEIECLTVLESQEVQA